MHRQLKTPSFLLGLAGALLGFWEPSTALADLYFRGIPDGSAYLSPLSQSSQTLPSAWRLNFPSTGFGPDSYGDPTMNVSIDPITGLVHESYREAGVEVQEPLVTSSLEYGSLLSSRTSRRLWRDKTRTTRSVERTQAARRGLFRFEVPVQLPKAVRSIVGDGAPNLEVSGSETITLAGKSDWTVGQSDYTGERKRPGAFPAFEMNQELNVNLTGSIGDKIKVDVDQSSNVQTSLDNKVKLRYEGDDDDMIKTVELGNTNLSLQGASIRQEGLFGIKTAARLGNVDLVTIASKQEGKNETARFTPSGDKTPVVIRDLNYIRGQYFLIADHPVKIEDYNTLEVWRDDANPNNNNNDKNKVGLARIDPRIPADSTLNPPPNPQIQGFWDPLIPEVDYTIRDDYWTLDSGLKIPVLRLTNPLGTGEMLAVSYKEDTPGQVDQVGTSIAMITSDGVSPDTLILKMIKPRDNDIPADSTENYDPNSAWYPVLPYHLRNFYDLGARNISTATMEFKIRRIIGGEAVYPDNIDGVPLIKILGLDQLDSQGQKGSDGRVDVRFVDAERGILFFPDLNPFDPMGGGSWPGCPPDSAGFLCLNDTFRNTLRRSDETANPQVYYRPNPDISRYYIEAALQSSRQGYFLGRFNVLEGSEQVKVNNIPWKRDVDYRIDYNSGQITFLKVPGPDDAISVDYSFAGGIGQVQRTLAGFSASYNPSADRSFSSSFLYESKGAQEQLVKLGEEPATSMIGDLSTVLSFRPVWMTQLANKIPGIRTSQPSALNFQGGYSASIPNPNTKGEAYLDDMEGNRESNTVSLTRSSWIWSSVPDLKPTLLSDHALIEWYNPTNVQERDLKPVLKHEEGAENTHQVLELNVKPPTGDSLLSPEDWTGVTLPIASVGQDLTRTQYFEIWVNDFNPDHASTSGSLHIDFGRVSEDAFWDPRNVPNGLLDTEDKNSDGRLDRSETYFEDTGLDGVRDEDEPGWNEATNPDPNGDDYAYTAPSTDYSRINNTEGNGLEDQNARPDTEDLNRNNVVDLENRYFETTIDLSDTQYVAIDVPRLYAGDPDVKPTNGWRLYRIPIADSTFVKHGSPTWSNIQVVRLWMDDMTKPTKLQIGGIELIGSRWLRQAFRDSTYDLRGVSLEVLARNNKDDAGIYLPPYQVQNTVGGTADRREQSLALAYRNLTPTDTVFAFKTFADAGGAQGWALYRDLRFYVHGDLGVESQKMRAIARFGPDTLNYYEYSLPVRTGWQPVVIPMERLSGLKERRGTDRSVVERDSTGEIFTVVGNPSFTRISRVSFGLTVDDTPLAPTVGEVWIDELRLASVLKERGFSSNATMQANLADFISLNGSYNRQDQDYFRVGQGTSQGSGFDHTAVGISSTINLDRFIPTSDVTLPVNIAVQHSSDVPKFRTGSDVILDEARSDVETREFNRQSISLSYRRSNPQRGFSRYTIDALSGNLNYAKQGSVSPQSSDSTWAFNTNMRYTVPIGGDGFKVGPLSVNPVPRTLTVGFDWSSSRDVQYSRTLSDSTDEASQELRSDLLKRLLSLDMTTSFEPLSSVRLSYGIRSTRDMLLHQKGGPLGWNKGTEVLHDQTVTLNYKPRWLTLLSPDIVLTGVYHENASSDRRGIDPVVLKDVTNSGSAHTNVTIPISRLGGRKSSVRDTSESFPLLAPLRFFFSKMRDVSATFDFSRTSAMSRVLGDPGLAFKSGFTQVFESDAVRLSPSTVVSSTRRYVVRGNTSFQPIDKLTLDAHGDYQLNFSDSYGSRRNSSLAWPDLNMHWSDLQRMLGLSKPLASLALNSNYRLQETETGPEDGPVQQRVQTLSLSPLLGWEATFKNGIRLSAGSRVERSETSDDRNLGYSQERSTKGTQVQVNKTFPAAKGIKLFGKRMRLPNDLNLGGTVDLSRNFSVLHRLGQPDYSDQDVNSLNVRSQTNYNFSQSISGGFNLEFRQTNDRKTSVTRRGITLAFTGSFRF